MRKWRKLLKKIKNHWTLRRNICKQLSGQNSINFSILEYKTGIRNTAQKIGVYYALMKYGSKKSSPQGHHTYSGISIQSIIVKVRINIAFTWLSSFYEYQFLTTRFRFLFWQVMQLCHMYHQTSSGNCMHCR